MPNLTPFDALRDVARFDPWRDFEDMFKSIRTRALLREPDMLGDISIDVTEDDKSYVVKAEVPGAAKEDIQVSIDGNQVAISAEIKREKEEKTKNTVRSERYYGKKYRSFMLDSEIDDAKAQANYKDGVLHLTLPKKAGTAARKLEIS